MSILTPEELVIQKTRGFTEADADVIHARVEKQAKIDQLRKAIYSYESSPAPDKRIDERLRELRAELKEVQGEQ